MKERRLGLVFGFLAALFIGIAGLVDLGSALIAAVVGHYLHGIAEAGSGVVELVIAFVTLVVTAMAARPFSRFELAGGLVLIALVVVEAVVLGFGGSLLTILGVVFSAISGVLFLASPGAIRRWAR